jgi:hypothetical protein
MTKNERDRLNIKTCLFFITANNEDEARGKAVAQAMEQLPGHEVFTIMVSVPPATWTATLKEIA